MWPGKSLQFLCIFVLRYVVLVCHQYDVCTNSVGSVFVGGYGGLSENGLCVFREFCCSL